MTSSLPDVTTLDEYQERAKRTDTYPGDLEKGLLVSILGLAGESGKLLTWYKKRIRDGKAYAGFHSNVTEELGDVLWYVANLATILALPLSQVANENLSKTARRWLQAEQSLELFDDEWPEAQQLPRNFAYEFATVRVKGATRVVLRVLDDADAHVGDPLTDNAYNDDGYRFHDVLHIAFAVHLGWSPVLRSLLKRKRKSDLQIDEVEDGARAQIIEEAIAAAVYYYAEDNSFLEGAARIDWELLRTIKRLSSGLEVSSRTEADWERAIFSGIGVWRQVRAANGGVIAGNLLDRRLNFQPPRNPSKETAGSGTKGSSSK